MDWVRGFNHKLWKFKSPPKVWLSFDLWSQLLKVQWIFMAVTSSIMKHTNKNEVKTIENTLDQEQVPLEIFLQYAKQLKSTEMAWFLGPLTFSVVFMDDTDWWCSPQPAPPLTHHTPWPPFSWWAWAAHVESWWWWPKAELCMGPHRRNRTAASPLAFVGRWDKRPDRKQGGRRVHHDWNELQNDDTFIILMKKYSTGTEVKLEKSAHASPFLTWNLGHYARVKAITHTF